jgi:uncharacterized protein YeaO (DUF488 family)
MIIKNKSVTWLLEKAVRRNRKYKELSFEYTRGYCDDEQVYEAFCRQYVAELREQVDLMVAELSKQIGEQL